MPGIAPNLSDVSHTEIWRHQQQQQTLARQLLLNTAWGRVCAVPFLPVQSIMQSLIPHRMDEEGHSWVVDSACEKDSSTASLFLHCRKY